MIDWESIKIVGGGLIALITAWFAHKKSKDKHKLELYDRAIKEIERLDDKLLEAEVELKKVYEDLTKEKSVNVELCNKLSVLKETIKDLQDKILKIKGGI